MGLDRRSIVPICPEGAPPAISSFCFVHFFFTVVSDHATQGEHLPTCGWALRALPSGPALSYQILPDCVEPN
jgi:hypothetical protein